jgi:tRNA(Ile)-lysidine synthase
MNDQAETLLLRLMRGSGAAGLGGMHPIRSLNPNNDRNQTQAVSLIRPFLCISREEVIEYCKDNALEYRTDSSNFLADYARNQIRHEIIPKLVELNPQVVSVLSTTADRLRGDEGVLQEEAVERLKSFSITGVEPLRFPVKLLVEAPMPIRRRMLREIIAIVRGGLSRITMQHLIATESLLKSGKSGKEVSIPGVKIQREFESLVLTKAGVDAGKLKRSDGYVHKLGANEAVRIGLNNRELIINLIRTEKYVWENRSRFVALVDDRQIELPLLVRPRQPGDRYVPIGANTPVKLKEIMIKNRIPLNERNRYPVIVTVNHDIVWSPGMPVARKFAATMETKNWLVVSARFGENADVEQAASQLPT